jgi:hypothetical protein
MPQSTRFSSGRRGGAVRIIEDRVTRSYIRTGKIAFWVVSVVLGALSASIAASYLQPILALFLGAVVGAVVGGIVAGVIMIWPVLRALWWWLPEITAGLAVVYGFWALCAFTTLPIRLLAVTVLMAPWAHPWVRTRAMRPIWCRVTWHRLRVSFNEFIISNNRGTLPFILWVWPTPVGERVWIWLRPGLALSDVTGQLDQLAAACWASTVTAERGSATNAALVRLNITRRDGLSGVVASDLVDHTDTTADSTPETITDDTAEQPATYTDPILNLDDTKPAEGNDAKRSSRKTPTAEPKTVTMPAATAAPAVRVSTGDPDAADWI